MRIKEKDYAKKYLVSYFPYTHFGEKSNSTTLLYVR